MTHRQIKHLAKELAGQFYEEETSTKPDLERNKRSLRFRKAFPKVKDYLMGHQHNPDGTVTYTKPGWMHHIVLARKLLTLMLGQSDARVSPFMKEQIYDALLEEHEQSTNPKRAENFVQRMN